MSQSKPLSFQRALAGEGVRGGGWEAGVMVNSSFSAEEGGGVPACPLVRGLSVSARCGGQPVVSWAGGLTQPEALLQATLP